MPTPPCVIFEDEHLLVVNKPAGWNTHAPSPYAGEGIYDWLRHREPRWATLAIIHRLDKETSGVLVFGKTPLANKSLTEQFTGRDVRKKYLLLAERQPKQKEFTVKSNITRLGERYGSAAHGEPAETRFVAGDDVRSFTPCPPGKLGTGDVVSCRQLTASPLTGRTHQIRVHAAESGFPILGDTLYGGTPFHRVCLHAAEISFTHPATEKPVCFTAAVDFPTDTGAALRAAIVEPEQTDAFRLIHGASDDAPGWFVDKLGNHLLSQSERPLSPAQARLLDVLCTVHHSTATYHKSLSRHVGRTTPAETSPKLVSGPPAPETIVIRENGVKFELSFNEGYSVGLFLDQRDNRRRFLTNHIAAGFPLLSEGRVTRDPKLHEPEKVGNRITRPSGINFELLNCFAYTCGFSVCAALGGARTTSLDLSRKYLEWGKRNFALNGLDPAAHDFIYGDTFDWMKRLGKKGRAFDAIALDPPTFSRSQESGVWRAEKDYGKLVVAALPLLKPDGILFCSTNAAELAPELFLEMIGNAIRDARRKIVKQHYVPQPPDFPISREEPGYLKTVWIRVK